MRHVGLLAGRPLGQNSGRTVTPQAASQALPAPALAYTQIAGIGPPRNTASSTRDIYNGRADVIVCDGFTGNVALKTSEGLIEAVLKLLRDELSSNLQAKVGALLSQQSFKRLKKRLDYSEYGGVPLIGLRGVTIICHGRSSSNAIKNAIRVTKEFAENQVNAELETALTILDSHEGLGTRALV